MKKANVFLILLGLSLIFAGIETTRAQWNLQSPLPTANSLGGATFVSPTHMFVCGTENLLLESTDAGRTWITRMYSGWGSDPFYAVHFAVSLHGYLIGNGFDAWGTSDGGATWFQMTSAPGGSMYHLDFITPTIGFIGGNGSLAFTSNGGVNWETKSAYPSCPVIYGMDFRDTAVGLVGGEMLGFVDPGPGIFKTTDTGTSWVRKFPSSANDVIWMNNSEAIATISTSIYRSTDVGETWTAIAGGITTGLLDLERTGSTTVVGVSPAGDIWRSTDGGFSWAWVLDGLGDLPSDWSVSFFDSLNGLVVGQGGLIFSSTDGGVTWAMLNNGMGVQIYDLQMYSNNFGIAACNNGYVLCTTNGGNHWDVQKLEVTGQIFGRDESLRGVSIVDTGFAVVAGPGGTVFRTTDGGITWQSIGYPVLPDAFWIEDVKFVNRLDGWLVGLDLDLGHQKTIYKTTDGGSTWVQAISSGAYMYSVDFVDTQHGMVTTAGGSYFLTTDGGATWVQQGYPPYFIEPTGVRVRFIDQNNGWVVGWDGFAARTIDGGNSWTIVDIGTTEDHLFNLSVISPSEVWAVGRENFSFDGLVYHTTNAGVTWSREVVTQYLPDLPYSISAFPSGDVWFGGYNGRIFKKNGSIIPVELVSFSGLVEKNVVILSWITATEINNRGFEVQRAVGNEEWSTIVFVNGNGTTIDKHSYSFTDENIAAGKYSYRLKQIDYDGTFEYSDIVKVDVNNIPARFYLEQNYPNPFNPTTKIKYSLATESNTKLTIYNCLGETINSLHSGVQKAGNYEYQFDGTGLPSGVYFYSLNAESVSGNVNFSNVKKMLIIK